MFDTQTFYRAECDDCGYRHEGYEYDYYPTVGDAIEDAQCDNWQIVYDEHGDCEHVYCPEHYHLTCHVCGDSVTQPVEVFLANGWEWDDDWEAICGECDMELTKQAVIARKARQS